MPSTYLELYSKKIRILLPLLRPDCVGNVHGGAVTEAAARIVGEGGVGHGRPGREAEILLTRLRSSAMSRPARSSSHSNSDGEAALAAPSIELEASRSADGRARTREKDRPKNRKGSVERTPIG